MHLNAFVGNVNMVFFQDNSRVKTRSLEDYTRCFIKNVAVNLCQ